MQSWGGISAWLCAFVLFVNTALGERDVTVRQQLADPQQRQRMETYATALIHKIEHDQFHKPLGEWSHGWRENLQDMNSVEHLTQFLADVDNFVLVPERNQRGYARMVDAGPGGRSVVIGDLHGQLWVLLPLLKEIRDGFSVHKDNKAVQDLLAANSKLLVCDNKEFAELHYVFLGDYVDRGDRSLYTILLLLAYKVLCPSQLTLLQGNHEQLQINAAYGFIEECQSLFGNEHGQTVWNNINRLFRHLPFVATISGKYVAMHGGLTSDFVNNCNNANADFSACLPASEVGLKRGRDTTWSDPMTQKKGRGFAPNVKRGYGEVYAPDVAQQFLAAHGLKGIVRGHEVQQEGVHDNGQGTITVFSAADYTTTFLEDAWRYGANKGGWMYIDHTALTTEATHTNHAKTGKELKKSDGPGWQILRGVFLELQSATSMDVREHWARTEASERQSETQRNRSVPLPSACTEVEGAAVLSAEEQSKYRAQVKEIMQEINQMDLAFEVTKMIDECGEAAVENMTELCKTLAEKDILLEVFSEMSSTKDKNEVLGKLRELMDALFNKLKALLQ